MALKLLQQTAQRMFDRFNRVPEQPPQQVAPQPQPQPQVQPVVPDRQNFSLMDAFKMSLPGTVENYDYNQRGLGATGEILRQTPDTTLQMKHPSETVPDFAKGNPLSLLFDNPRKRFNRGLTQFVTSMPGDYARGWGDTLGRFSSQEGMEESGRGLQQLPQQTKELFTEGWGEVPNNLSEIISNPGVQDTLNVADVFGALSLSSLFKGGGQEATQQAARQALQEGAQEGVEKVAREGSESVLKNVADDVAEKTARHGGQTAVELAQEAAEKTGIKARPFHQVQIEELLNSGQLDEAYKLAKSIPETDSYRQPMLDMIENLYGYKPQAIIDDLRPPQALGGRTPQLAPNGAVDFVQLPNEASLFTTPDGTTLKMSEIPQNTAQLDNALEKAAGVNPQTVRTTDQLFLGDGGDSARLALPEKSSYIEPDSLAKAVKEEGGLTKGANWFERNIQETKRLLKNSLPDRVYKQFDDEIANPLRIRNAQAEDFGSKYTKRVQSLGPEFKKGSRYSELLQRYGEGNISDEALYKEVGLEGFEKIKHADEVFRRTYDDMIKEVNALRVKDGLKEIPYREDYYRWAAESSDDLSSLLNVEAHGTAAQAPSLSIQMRRTGANPEKYDAVGGFLDYVERAKRAAYTDKVAADTRSFSKNMRKAGANKDIVYKLDQWADRIDGVRPEQGKVVGTASRVANKIKKSRVVGNASTLINQFMGVPVGAGDAGYWNFTRGQFDNATREAAEKSAYLKVRKASTPTNLYKGLDAVDAKMGRALQVTDGVASETMWKGFYQKALSEGVDDPIRYADDAVEAVIGSRAIGGGNQWLNSPMGQLLTPFVSEPTAQANRLRQMMGEKRFGSLLGIFVGNYFINKLTEKAYGQRPALDPIETTIKTYRMATGDDETEQNELNAAANMFAGILEFSPVAESAFNTAYKTGEMAGLLPDSREVFGSEDKTGLNAFDLYNPLQNVIADGKFSPREVTGNPAIDTLWNVGTKFTRAGNQADKTARGIRSIATNEVKSRAGNTMFAGPDNIPDAVKAVLFGPYETSEAENYFASDFSRPLTKEQQKQLATLPKEEKGDFIRRANEQTRSKFRTEDMIARGQKTGGVSIDDAPTSGAQAGGSKSSVTTPEQQVLLDYYYDGKTYDRSAREGQRDILTKTIQLMEDENLNDEQKARIIEAAGVPPQDLTYYQEASTNEVDRLEKLMQSASRQYENRDDLMIELLLGKRQVAGKSMYSTNMYDRLYDEGIISKDEKKLISSIKYDPVFNQFYLDRDYKPSGGVSQSKANSYIRSVNSLYKNPFEVRKTERSYSPQSSQDNSFLNKSTSELFGRMANPV